MNRIEEIKRRYKRAMHLETKKAERELLQSDVPWMIEQLEELERVRKIVSDFAEVYHSSGPPDECEHCGGEGVLDSGGFDQSDQPINVPCSCREQPEPEEEWEDVARGIGLIPEMLLPTEVAFAKLVVQERKENKRLKKVEEWLLGDLLICFDPSLKMRPGRSVVGMRFVEGMEHERVKQERDRYKDAFEKKAKGENDG